MKIFLFVDGWVGAQVLMHLKSQDENIAGIAVHPADICNNFDEIKKCSGLPDGKIYTVGKHPSAEFIGNLKKINPDIILVVFWTYILSKEVFSIPKYRCINFHMSYLPFNRGKKPNVWPIIENTPAGVSMHYIDSGIDSGEILFRKEVKVEITDTAQTLYLKQLVALSNLFIENWINIKNNKLNAIENIAEEGTFHWDKDFKQLDEINLDNVIISDETGDLNLKIFDRDE